MKKLGILAMVIVGVCLLASCGQKWRDVEKIKKSGEIVLYTEATWPPFEYIGEAGKVEGIDIDIAQAIADDLGVSLRIINAAFDGFSLAITNGQADMAISAVTITEERRENLDFSEPYTSTVQYIVKLERDTQILSFPDLGGRRIGAQLGTTGDMLVSDHIREGLLKGTGAEVLQFKTLQEAMLGLLKGDPFAIVCDETVAKNLVAVNPGTNCIPVNSGQKKIVEDEFYGIAIAKGNKTLVDAANATLKWLAVSGSIDKSIVYHTENSALYAVEEE